MSPLAFLGSMALAAVAAWWVLRPFSRLRREPLEGPSDPLEEERAELIGRLRDLEDDRATGELDEAEYVALRRETEAGAVAVLRALEARDGAGELAAGLRELRSGSPNGSRGDGAEGERAGGTGRRRAVAGAVAGLVAAAAVIPALAGAVGERERGQPITGSTPEGSGIEFFEGRVQDHPGDLAARLDLAQRYLQVGRAADAVAQYVAALEIDPQNPEAHSRLGYLLFASGRAEDGLRAVDRAIGSDPAYAEAHYFRGLILLEGLDRPAEAAEALREYLEMAPFGSYRAQAEALLGRADPA